MSVQILKKLNKCFRIDRKCDYDSKNKCDKDDYESMCASCLHRYYLRKTIYYMGREKINREYIDNSIDNFSFGFVFYDLVNFDDTVMTYFDSLVKENLRRSRL